MYSETFISLNYFKFKKSKVKCANKTIKTIVKDMPQIKKDAPLIKMQ